MADEYINRAKFCEYLRTRKAESADDYGRGWKNGIIATEKAARGFPAADVALVIHAHWVQTSKGVIYCSNCGAVCGIGAHIEEVTEDQHFCYYCGAKMDEEDIHE